MNPWRGFAPASCFPDKCQCEMVQDGLIRQPSAFWSSLAYLLAAFAIYRHIASKSAELKLWTLVCVLMGLSSLFGHASFINLALALDFASIILVLSFFALLNFFLRQRQSYERIVGYFVLYYGSLYGAMYYLGKWPKIIFCLLIFLFSLADIIREAGWTFFRAKSIQLSLLVLTVSFAMFLIDEFHLYCDPGSWFQWHSLWHIGTAISIYYYGKWRFSAV